MKLSTPLPFLTQPGKTTYIKLSDSPLQNACQAVFRKRHVGSENSIHQLRERRHIGSKSCEPSSPEDKREAGVGLVGV
eukprot:1156510-Pelagomonas_calceolata.AAC.13